MVGVLLVDQHSGVAGEAGEDPLFSSGFLEEEDSLFKDESGVHDGFHAFHKPGWGNQTRVGDVEFRFQFVFWTLEKYGVVGALVYLYWVEEAWIFHYEVVGYRMSVVPEAAMLQESNGICFFNESLKKATEARGPTLRKEGPS